MGQLEHGEVTHNRVTFDARMRVLSTDPPNAETSLADATEDLTPDGLFYLRNHFSVPFIHASSWSLQMGGLVERPLTLSLDDLRQMAPHTVTATLECAGNGRTSFQPPVAGEPWEWGAVSTARWTGVPLHAVLERAGIQEGTVEILFEGADSGTVAGLEETIPYVRSLPLHAGLHPDTLLAYAMNGKPLPPQHGYPLRMIVPGWYGMAAVKWVMHIEAIDDHFTGYYQRQRYIMEYPDRHETTPLTTMAVRSLITDPAAGARLPDGRHTIRGLAWSGNGPITAVEVSVDGGATWESARVVSTPDRYTWRRWEYEWTTSVAGPAALCSRATDEAGNTQPETADWNTHGYRNNAIQCLSLVIEPR